MSSLDKLTVLGSGSAGWSGRLAQRLQGQHGRRDKFCALHFAKLIWAINTANLFGGAALSANSVILAGSDGILLQIHADSTAAEVLQSTSVDPDQVLAAVRLTPGSGMIVASDKGGTRVSAPTGTRKLPRRHEPVLHTDDPQEQRDPAALAVAGGRTFPSGPVVEDALAGGVEPAHGDAAGDARAG